MTQCIQELFTFASVGSRFDGEHVVSDGGALLPGEVERQANIWHCFTACFIDQRDPLPAIFASKAEPTQTGWPAKVRSTVWS